MVCCWGEKRKALHQPCRHGLDPRDAAEGLPGVEWLGLMPEHWSICPVADNEKITDKFYILPETENGTYAFVSGR